MAKIIAVTNQKGGVGKTTTAVNLSALVAEAGKRVLIVDIDPQGNATSGLGKADTDSNTVYEVLMGDAPARDAIVETGFGALHLMPTAIELAGAEIELVSVEGRETLLKKALEPLRDDYDFIFIDCPPSLSLLTLNALTAADSVLIPIQCEYYALEGVGQLVNTIKLMRMKLNPELKVEGILLTMYDARTNLCAQVVQEVRNQNQSWPREYSADWDGDWAPCWATWWRKPRRRRRTRPSRRSPRRRWTRCACCPSA